MEENTPPIQVSPQPEKRSSSLFKALFVGISLLFVLGIGLLGGFFLRGATKSPQITSTAPTEPTSTTAPKQQSNYNSLFLAYLDDNNGWMYQVVLYDPAKKQIQKKKTINVKSLGWDVSPQDPETASANGTTPIQYNPNTNTIVMVLRPTPGGEGGYRPADAPPQSPYQSAIYTTSFNPNDPLKEVIRLEKDSISYVELVPSKNSLIYVTKQTNGTEIISEVNLDNKSVTKLGEIPGENGRFNEFSNIALSKDQSTLYQLLTSSPKAPDGGHMSTNQQLSLYSLNLTTKKITNTAVSTGDTLEASISGLSSDGMTLAFYSGWKDYQFHIATLSTAAITTIPMATVNNFGVRWSGDNKKILIGAPKGWNIYDLKDKTMKSVLFRYPFSWSLSTNYIVGISDTNNIVTHDVSTDEITDLGIHVPGPYAVLSAQWR